VVYNHTPEGNHLGPTLCFRGIDNASYYRLMPNEKRHYINDTGTGNTLNLSHPRVLQMVLDSLHYWVTEMHVDGFRFDLASTVGREDHGFDQRGGFFDAIRQAPWLRQTKLIAEPWDIGPGGYQLGQFPPGWSEWNDRYRDTVRCYWRGDERMLPELAARICASADLFDHRGRRPWSTVNFITAHDGFTLHDLVSYNDKHNEANLEENRDGHSENRSYNFGVEGETDDPDIITQREQQKRNFLATLLLSQGTPMILAGDERGHTQKGNNNAYCQDNEISWLDWESEIDNGALIGFLRRMIEFRQAHPVLRSSRFMHGRVHSPDGIKDITWFTPQGSEKTTEQWQDGLARCVGILLNGRAHASLPAGNAVASDEMLLIIMNSHNDVVDFTLPSLSVDVTWRRVIDTVDPQGQPEPTTVEPGQVYPMPGRSLVIFTASISEDSEAIDQ
jgi:glycogen operon protein